MQVMAIRYEQMDFHNDFAYCKNYLQTSYLQICGRNRHNH